MLSLHDRYQHDTVFRQLVDTMFMFIQAGNTTPTEVREAAMLAQIMYEERKPKLRMTTDQIEDLRR